MTVPQDRQTWDAYVLGHPHGHPYQLYGFHQAIENAYGFRPLRFLAVERGSGRTVGAFPLVHVHLPLGRGHLVSLPYCDAGGPLGNTPGIEAALLSHVLLYAQDRGMSRVVVRSTREFADLDPERTRNSQKALMLLPLPDSPEKLMASFKAKVRSQVKKPMKDGLTAHLGGRELIRPFYRIFRENMRDLGSPVHAMEWISQILSSFGNRAHIGLVRLPDGQPAAGGVILCHSRVVSIPWASALRRFNRLNPNMRLYWQFLAFAAARQYPTFDFGRSTPGEGTFRFKKQWGASPRFLHWAEFNPRSYTGGTPEPIPEIPPAKGLGLREKAEYLLSRMPLPILGWVGRRTRRYITL